jgi:hypothetical protein
VVPHPSAGAHQNQKTQSQVRAEVNS